MDYDLMQQKCLAIAAFDPTEEENVLGYYGSTAIASLMKGERIPEANERLRRISLYMHVPHPLGLDVHGEADFAALRLIIALNTVYDRMEEKTKEMILRFFAEDDYTSMYGSENHVFIMRVARFLAAEFYDMDFKQFGLTRQQVLVTDKKYLIDFIRFRARYGLGEFVSDYAETDFFVLSVLYHYAKDEEVRHMAQMGIDLIAIEIFHNMDKAGCLCGGRGRTYDWSILCTGPMHLKRLLLDEEPTDDYSFILAPFAVHDFVLDAFRNRTFPMEIRESKHLHSMDAWRTDQPKQDKIDRLLAQGGIYKYTYLCEHYGLGAINHQDDYLFDDPEDAIYAHHQQVEWSCVLPALHDREATKLFSTHPGKNKEHSIWTGDLGCCCNHSFANKDTALALYNIRAEDQLNYTHLFIEPEQYDKIEKIDKSRYCLERGPLYLFLYIANGATMMKDESHHCHELRSQGVDNAYGLRIYFKKDFTSFDEFCQKTASLPISFDGTTLNFDGLILTKDTDPEQELYPYTVSYESPVVHGKWGEGVLTVVDGTKQYVLDFEKGEIRS